MHHTENTLLNSNSRKLTAVSKNHGNKKRGQAVFSIMLLWKLFL